MARGWAWRCLLTGLHVCAGLSASGSLVAVLLQWAQDLNCLPPVTDGFGDPLPVKNALGHACDVITYGSGVVCALNLLMGISLNCCWGEWCCSFFLQILTLLMCTLSAAYGAALTVDFMLWCHSLQNTVAEYHGCESAAALYDKLHKTNNMTSYFRKMEMQQVCQWAVVPFLLCAMMIYSIAMRANATEPLQQVPVGGRYYILPDESAPLLVPETSCNARGISATEMLNSCENARSSDPVFGCYTANSEEGNTNVTTDRA